MVFAGVEVPVNEYTPHDSSNAVLMRRKKFSVKRRATFRFMKAGGDALIFEVILFDFAI
jgi:hypothetical protein